MSERLRLAPAFVLVAVGVALALEMSPPRAGSTADPLPDLAVGGIALPVADIDRSVAFYSTVLFFDKISDVQTSDSVIGRRAGVPGARARVVTMQLGTERIELVQYLDGMGRPVARHGRSNDRRLEHIAIAVNDIEQADLWLRRHGVALTGPEAGQAPDCSSVEDGTRTLSFVDPDGHALELLQFARGTGDARWQRPSDRVFLGIDHEAIVVQDTERSVRFYRDGIGMGVTGTSETHRVQPGRPNDAAGARLRTTTLRAAEGPAIELVEHLDPRQGRVSEDPAGWQTVLVTSDAEAVAAKLGFRRGLTPRDPDGHRVQLRAS